MVKKTITQEIEVCGDEVRSICKTYTITKEVDLDEEIEKKNKESINEYIEQEYEQDFIDEAEKKFEDDWERDKLDTEHVSPELENVEGDVI